MSDHENKHHDHEECDEHEGQKKKPVVVEQSSDPASGIDDGTPEPGHRE